VPKATLENTISFDIAGSKSLLYRTISGALLVVLTSLYAPFSRS
jgi:hypothetical protein